MIVQLRYWLPACSPSTITPLTRGFGRHRRRSRYGLLDGIRKILPFGSECHTIKDSATKTSGTIEEAFEANRNDPCDYCALEKTAEIEG